MRLTHSTRGRDTSPRGNRSCYWYDLIGQLYYSLPPPGMYQQPGWPPAPQEMREDDFDDNPVIARVWRQYLAGLKAGTIPPPGEGMYPQKPGEIVAVTPTARRGHVSGLPCGTGGTPLSVPNLVSRFVS
jgi:hypothetical protein